MFVTDVKKMYDPRYEGGGKGISNSRSSLQPFKEKSRSQKNKKKLFFPFLRATGLDPLTKLNPDPTRIRNKVPGTKQIFIIRITHKKIIQTYVKCCNIYTLQAI
jgi:hypothetical protein